MPACRRRAAFPRSAALAGSGTSTAEDLATSEAFARDPELVWGWYAWRRKQIAECRPNAAHDVIAAWSVMAGEAVIRPRCDSSPGAEASTRRLKVTVLTQNVDDLHVLAGTRNLVRLHGSVWELSCWDRCAKGSTPWRDERVPLAESLPRCPHCGHLARPAVVWFGEPQRSADARAALRATACDVFLNVGTSSIVYPAAALVHEAQRQGAFTAEVNLETTPASSIVDIAIQGGAERILPMVDNLLNMCRSTPSVLLSTRSTSR